MNTGNAMALGLRNARYEQLDKERNSKKGKSKKKEN
jgi:hypothetical protein